jgi:hypothetical protein
LIKQKDARIAALTKSLTESEEKYLEAIKELEINLAKIKSLEGQLVSSE